MESKRVRSSIVMRKSRRTNSGLDTSGNRQVFFTEQAKATQEICIVQEHNHHGKKGTNLSCSLGGTFENRLQILLLYSAP